MSDREDSQISDSELSSAQRSRSASRRARRRKQAVGSKPSKGASKMPSVPEGAEARSSAQVQQKPPKFDPKAKTSFEHQYDGEDPGPEQTMQPFEWIGKDETSMDGPVTYARAMRGEIPMRPGNPNQHLQTAERTQESNMMDQDGLKLRLELNLDIEVELKARIHGDLTLALLA